MWAFISFLWGTSFLVLIVSFLKTKSLFNYNYYFLYLLSIHAEVFDIADCFSHMGHKEALEGNIFSYTWYCYKIVSFRLLWRENISQDWQISPTLPFFQLSFWLFHLRELVETILAVPIWHTLELFQVMLMFLTVPSNWQRMGYLFAWVL